MNRIEYAEYIIRTYSIANGWDPDYLVYQYTFEELKWLEKVCKSTSYCEVENKSK